MERLLIYIKHHLGFIWRMIEKVNGYLFILLFGRLLKKTMYKILSYSTLEPYQFRPLKANELKSLADMIALQPSSDLEYFSPHEFDLKSLEKQMSNPAFLMMGVWGDHGLVGYFFLRFFTNKKCFVGRLIDKQYRGKGIGPVMNQIMYELAWELGFRCMSTISKNNKAVMRAHEKNPNIVFRKELPNDYLLVEFLRES